MSVVKIQPLSPENYDTWIIHAKAYLVKNMLWKYVCNKPISTSTSKELEEDELAKSELLLLISPSELKQVKNCRYAKDVWETLDSIYASKGPARKANLLKQLILSKLNENGDVKEHLKKFIDIVDKLKDLDIDINSDLLTIMMLCSLSSDYENFRIAIETQENLIAPEKLKIKIIEEYEAPYRDLPSTINRSNNDEEIFYAFCKICKKKGHLTEKCWKNNKFNNKNNAKYKGKEYKNNFSCYFLENYAKKGWILDSGCTAHMTNSKKHFKKINKTSKVLKLASNGKIAEILGEGPAQIKIDKGVISIKNALYVPTLSANLLSVGQMTDMGQTILFTKNKAVIKDTIRGVEIEAIREKDGLYYLKTIDCQKVHVGIDDTNEENILKINKENTNSNDIKQWHQKLGHMCEKDMKFALRNNCLIGLDINPKSSLGECEICIEGKLHKTPIKAKVKTVPRTTKRLEIVHSDVCGPIQTASIDKNKYIVTFIDDFSRYSRVYFIKNKNEVFDKFKEYKTEVEKFTEEKIKCLQTDNSTEYCNKMFINYLKENGISRRLSAPYTPEQNGVAERKNRTLLEKARCLMLEAKAPMFLWAEAIFTANYLSNRSINQSIGGATPFEKWVGRKPYINHLYIFGSKTFVLKKNNHGHKFASKAMIGVFVGYSESRKAFRIYVPALKRVIESVDIRAIKKMFYNDNNSEKKEIKKHLNCIKNKDPNTESDEDEI